MPKKYPSIQTEAYVTTVRGLEATQNLPEPERIWLRQWIGYHWVSALYRGQAEFPAPRDVVP